MEKISGEERALRILDEVNSWLRFAEAKNGALLALATGVIVGLLQSNTIAKLSGVYLCWFWWFVGSLCLSIVAMLASFYARTNKDAYSFVATVAPESGNLFFFGDLHTMSVACLCERVGCQDVSAEQRVVIEDIARQIITNSKIAQRKYIFFNFALSVVIVGCLSPLGLLLFHWRVSEKL